MALAIPDLIPALAPLSVSYHRTRFAQGMVSLRASGQGAIERQVFSMDIDRYEGRWALNRGHSSSLAASIFMGYDRRGLPRHIYLKERVSIGEEESYHIYSDISDQMLWTVSKTWDLGITADIEASDQLRFNIDALFGLGGYELFTPLEGQSLDRGTLLSLGFKLGVEYAVPLNSWLTFKTSYLLSARSFEPIGLPDQLSADLKREGTSTNDLSLGFGTIDLLHRAWVSLVFNIATRSISAAELLDDE